MFREIGVTNKTGCTLIANSEKKADLYKNILATLHLHGEVT